VGYDTVVSSLSTFAGGGISRAGAADVNDPIVFPIFVDDEVERVKFPMCTLFVCVGAGVVANLE